MEALEARYPQLASRNSSEVERRAVDRPTLTLNGVLGLGRWRRALNNVKHEGNRTGDHGHGNYLFHGRLRWRSSESGSHVSVGATTPRPGGGKRLQGAHHGDLIDERSCQHDSWHRLERAKFRVQRGSVRNTV